jgi:hypothetical protein
MGLASIPMAEISDDNATGGVLGKVRGEGRRELSELNPEGHVEELWYFKYCDPAARYLGP